MTRPGEGSKPRARGDFSGGFAAHRGQRLYHPLIALLKAHRVSLVALLLTAGLFWWLCGWSGDGVNRAPGAAAVLVIDGVWALLWLASALGLGGMATRCLVPATRSGLALEAALGVAVLLVVDAILGRIGLLASAIGAWATLAPGLGLLAARLARERPRVSDLPALLLAATPAVAVLLVAACSAPGALWTSEFGGYDALSYHLELPRAWCAGGRIEGLEYNVYSFLPSYVEGAYLHLFALRGGSIDAVFSCQLLHVGLTLLAAGVVGRVATMAAGATAGSVATVLTLGTPWIVVVGSLAYNEMAVVLLAGGGLGLLLDDKVGTDRLRTGVAVGLLAGAACGAKLTAIGFAALPIGVLLLMTTSPWRKRIAVAGIAVVTGALTLAPYAAGNAAQTGNPIFPFATGIFGAAHWTEDQAETWKRGHATDVGPGERVREGLRQLAHDDAPDVPNRSGRRARSQWSVLPWLTIVGVAIAGLAREHRRVGLRLFLFLGFQTIFWLGFTHIKSRFMVPAIVPSAVAIGIAVAATTGGLVVPITRQLVTATVGILLTLYALLPVTTFGAERSGATFVDAIEWMNGVGTARRLEAPDITAAEREELRSVAWPSWWVNHALPAGSRVLGIGESVPLYYAPDVFDYQTTWDRGPLSAAMRATDDPAGWLRLLRDNGYTHVLVNPAMLSIWERERWNDPLITTGRVLAALDAHATPLKRWDYGMVLYTLAQ